MDPADFPYRVLDEAGVKAQTSIRRGFSFPGSVAPRTAFTFFSWGRR